jgi:methionyl-tRNA synthetase
MKDTVYITTPIYYVNSPPHIGTAYTTIAVDALARYHRARGRKVFLATGTDEHGEKIEESAKAAGVDPKTFADGITAKFRATWKNLLVSEDRFIRTTDPDHAPFVADLWKRMEAAGDIYFGEYEGWYCVGCESFYTDAQLVDGNCPVHQTPVRRLKEASYFFRLSRYQDRLLQHFEQNPGFVTPEGRRNEIVSFIKGGLRDLSVSRSTFSWGIKVPGDDKHVIYVWVDALANYVSILGGPGAPLYDTFWPADCHVVGKDILRHHSVYWPCFLMSAGLPLPKMVLAHGWWTVRGQKISKSMPATRVDPNALVADIGADALRYFLLREVPLGLDGDFAFDALIGRINSDLANDLGNLVNRTVAMTDKYVGGVVPAASPALDQGGIHADLAALAVRARDEAQRHFEAYAPSRALEAIWELVRGANRYVDAAGPWTLAKDPARRAELDHVLHTFLEAVLWSARLVAPAMPSKAAEILGALGVAGGASWPSRWNEELPAGGKVSRGAQLFPRIDEARAKELMARWTPPDAAGTPPPEPEPAPKVEDSQVTFDEFSRLDLRVAVVKSAEKVPKAQKLLKVVLDIGGETRQVVAGIAEAYAPEELIGRRVIFLANLKPKPIKGIESQGMILAAGADAVLALSATDRDVPAGTKIR